MANIKSAIKRIKTSEKRRLRNRRVKSQMRTFTRRFESTLSSGEGDPEEALRQAIRVIDRAAGKGVIHKNNAARKKARLQKIYNEAQTG
ncbi:MAG: 30S ribosomal protein S20 [Bacillota bacterium]